MIQSIRLGKNGQLFPKFRLSGTASSGDVHPVQFETELLNVEAVINAGVFLCVEPGYYHFSGALSSGGLELKLSTMEEVRFLQGELPARK